MEKRKYRPSNGTEGEYFMSEHCYQCIHDNPDYDAKSPRCEIMTFVMCFDTNDKEYPKEWIYGDDGKPTCTKFKKWDWGNDGNPDDIDNPKAPIPENPNQLVMPFEIDTINENIQEQELTTQSILKTV